MLPKNTKIFPDIQSLSEYACTQITDIANNAIQKRQRFRIVLSGGSTPSKVYQLLTSSQQDWSHWEIFWGDERCLPVDHPERNSFSARHDWLDHAAIPDDQIYPIPAELGAEQATEKYRKLIADKMPFDLVLLGMGEDGHTASLFPDNPACESVHEVVAVASAPKPPSERVSLNFTALKNTHEEIILVSGAGKAEALFNWEKGENLPIAQACVKQAILLLDDAAASRLSVTNSTD